MALFEYICLKCKHEMEKIIFTEKEESLLRCEKCKSKVSKKISIANFAVHGYSANNGYSKEKK